MGAGAPGDDAPAALEGAAMLLIAPRLQTVLVLLAVGDRQVGLPVAIVQDVVTVQRAGSGLGWRERGAALGAICPTGMLAVGDRCIPLVELGCWLGGAPVPCTRRVRTVVVVQSGEHVVGLLADAVADIVEAPCAALAPVAPSIGQHPAVRQIAHLDIGDIAVLDVDRLLGTMPPLPSVRHMR